MFKGFTWIKLLGGLSAVAGIVSSPLILGLLSPGVAGIIVAAGALVQAIASHVTTTKSGAATVADGKTVAAGGK